MLATRVWSDVGHVIEYVWTFSNRTKGSTSLCDILLQAAILQLVEYAFAILPFMHYDLLCTSRTLCGDICIGNVVAICLYRSIVW